jgi:serine/threonine protein kinase
MTERFTLLSELGRGGMGVVWKARDEETGQLVALKLLREAYAEDPEYLARFERELELAKRIYSRNVVEVLGFGVRGKVPYLALEYVDGPSLHDTVVAHGPYTWAETQPILTQITQGLADAHAAGVVHRDVKPSNVLIGRDGTAKLTDFGIARGLDLTRVTATSTLLGTPAYLAPEGPKDGRSDLYSLGVIGYELLTGAVPFKGTTYQEVIVEHVRTPPDLTKLPAEARPIIGWLLAKNPAARPQRASDLLPVLYGASQIPVQVQADQGDEPAALRSAALPGRGQGRVIVVAALIALIALVAVPATLFVVRSSGGSLASSAPPASVSTEGLASDIAASSVASTSATLTPPPKVTHPSGTFSPTGSMFTGRYGQTATLLPNGLVLIAGGYDGARYLATAELYDPQKGTFSQTGSMSIAREVHTATLLPNGLVLITGGESDSGSLGTAELYDPEKGTFSPTDSMSRSREWQTATLLPNGRVLIVGGDDGSVHLATAELYDPQSGTFSPTGSMLTRRDGQAATLLATGRVLISGGYDGSRCLAAAEIYDPQSGTFRPTGSMSIARDWQTATLLTDGRILITGGNDGSAYLATAEIYDPASGTFSPVGSMSIARDWNTATLLADGRVLVSGGDSPGTAATAELYAPNGGSFTRTGPMSSGREGQTATLLPDGRVLITGGHVGSTSTAGSELYTP